ncbi:hypothetical protein DL766_005949 [Monosporascus sp. MC13-8B]|uniref:Uncharacterized protein n=1 Tax=Monosporascus cannonballus TaxID=155416 RepID=A0ABY0HA61_9PEZI|nr:hypothetical protein DL762_004043 [Monosporascus cannonballus]RYO97802.1 hypothetical protein DL763_002598 [Monosporascus cannonballus]RYP28286.1 hypothetical protein DL766_005949 [Monosporascus sp. MC13-8B]
MRTPGEVLASDGDLIVEVIEQGRQTPDAAVDQRLRKSVTFQVSKSRTAEYMDLSKTDASHVHDHVVIQGETIKAARLWLQTFHKATDLDSWALQEFAITDVFHAWYDHHVRPGHARHSVTTGEFLLAPAYWFDCAVIFRDVTKELAYGSVRHHGDLTPRGVLGMGIQGIPGPVLSGMYSARSNLRTQTHRELYRSPRSHINCDDRKCRDVMVYRYFVALDATGSFPVNYGENRHKSVNRLLSDAENVSLEIVELNPNAKHASWICNPCRRGIATQTARALEGQVREGINRVRRNFEGLCLDCMHKYKTGDKDCDYWNHARTMDFSKGCRFHHDEPTWYYSYMGRDDEMKKFKTTTPRPGNI